MRPARVLLLGALAVTSAILSAAATGSSAAPSPARATAVPAFPLVVPCGFSHRNRDDPIVHPGRPGRSHDHTFFGNRSTNAFSTPKSLRAARRTTCGQPADTAAYWAPTLFVGRRAILPAVLVATYRRTTTALVEPYPAGLKLVAGDSHARRPQSTAHVYWSCVSAPDRRWSTIPTCAGIRRGLQLNVEFPNCWNGRRTDSPDHRSHMAYSSDGACPASHPVAVPALSVQITYPVVGGPQAMPSSGRFATHADFFNAWDQGTFAGLVDRYFNGKA